MLQKNMTWVINGKGVGNNQGVSTKKKVA